jgi:type IV pilus assembly protein PilC
MLVKVIPTLRGIFDQQGATLPIATRILLSMSDFIRVYWYIVLLLVVGIVVFLRFFLASESGTAVKDQLQIRVPGFKKLYEGMYMYRLTQVMSMLLGAGVPLLNAIKIGASVVNNGVYEEAMLSVAKYVERGVPLSVQLMKEPVFPQLIGQMAAVGEETGQLDQVLAKISDYYKESTDQMIKTISSLVEPIILVLMGAAVAFLVFAVLVPIYSVSQMTG